MSDERRRVVSETLRFVAGQVWADLDGHLPGIADEIDRLEPIDWWCCPLCEETVCDEGCPLLPLRKGVVYDVRDSDTIPPDARD